MGKLLDRWKAFTAREKEKTKGLTFRKKAEYFFTYYRVEAFGVLVALCLIAGLVYVVNARSNVQILAVGFVDTTSNLANNEKLAKEFKEYIGNTDRKERIYIDSNLSACWMDEKDKGEYSQYYEYQEKSALMVGAGMMDAYLCTLAYADYLEDMEDLLPVSKALGPKLCEAYADQITDDRALLLPKGAAEACGFEYEPVYLVFSKSVHYPDVVRSFAQFLMEKK